MINKAIFVFVCCFALLASISPVTSAANESTYDETFFAGNNIVFYNPNAACTETGNITTDADAIIDTPAGEADRARVIMQYFVDKGLSLAAAAGFAGNMRQESGLNPAVIQGGINAAPAQKTASGVVTNTDTIYKPVDSKGFGLVQWTFGGTVEPRQGPLYQKAVRDKVDIIGMGIQLDYVWKELNVGYKTSTLDPVKNMTDPVKAAVVVHDNYEISDDTDEEVLENRGGNAIRYYNLFKNKIDDGSGSISDAVIDSDDICSVKDNSAGGIGSIEGFTFPLKTTQAALKKGINGSTWCFDQKTNCHHDYNAADIFAETGTPIVAAADGKVVSVKLGSCAYYGCNVTVMGDDGFLYYYTHMSQQARVRIGQTVQAGHVIGAVGTDATAMNTPRHLHFDMLPGKEYKFRPGCSSAACSSYPFKNVQEALVPSFETLPGGGSA